MPLTIAQILQVSAPAVLNEMGYPHFLLEVAEFNGVWAAVLGDSVTGLSTSFTWAPDVETANAKEYQRVNLVVAYLKNAVQTLTELIEEQT